MNKEGASGMWSIILYMILGILVLGILLFFIFNEFWTGEGGDREVCWQNIQLRSAALDTGSGTGRFSGKVNPKTYLSLDCKTHVVEISESDVREVKNAQEKIADAIVDCWALYGNGDLNAFPADFFSDKSICVSCARIHLSSEAKKYMKEKDVKISIADSLDDRMDKDFTYYSYLKNSGDKFSAFDLAASREFDFKGDRFRVDEDNQVDAVFVNRLNGGKVSQSIFGLSTIHVNKVFLPEFFYYDKGDLMINYGIAVSNRDSAIGNYIPYMFYVQSGQNDFFEQLNAILIDGALRNVDVCESWEGIPA